MFRRLREGRRESGASAVEFALLLPLLTALLFGMLQYGFYFWSKSSATSAAREGARRSSVGEYASCGSNPTTSSAPQPATSFRRFVYDQAGGAVPKQNWTITRSFTKATGNTDLTHGQAGDVMRITLTFKAFDVGLIPLPGRTLTKTITSRVESVKTPLLDICS